MAVEVDFYYDLVCPWCYLGKRRLERALAQINGEFPVQVHWRPYELNPQMPAEGMDRRVYLEQKFGGADAARELEAGLTEAGRVEGIEFAFESITREPNSFNAHRLVQYARGQNREEALVERLFKAYLLQGEDIGLTETLERLGGDVLATTRSAIREFLESREASDQVREEQAGGARLNLTGVPAFVIDRNIQIVGAREPEVLVEALSQAASEAGWVEA